MLNDSAPILQKSREYAMALVWDLTAAMAREYGVPTGRYPIAKHVAERIASPWQRMERYLAPPVLEQIHRAFDDFVGTPWRAITESDVTHVTFRTAQRDISPTDLRTTLSGLRVRSALVTPQGVRRPPESYDLDLELAIDLTQGQITGLLVLPREAS